ncbi:hypothetical protein DSCO28_34680 [Desulfosarcina ovata subsp. sediminis]|uniref:Sensory/regulatory protein RpfC n=1 Tax=Desulfosarcina ovata subsp. sediminis TaxID=885957 RepID=A0A5K7ZL49_9BACT|nr:response regulator [Desulfosarcina ovata]BBO82902.1 hypothetical protein DSCO28_34680 [Desulfosarcina ovata subsp. sediminis]
MTVEYLILAILIAVIVGMRLRQGRKMRRNVQETMHGLKRLSKAVDQSPASVVITDRNGTIEYVNARFCEVTGYTATEAIGQNPRILKAGNTPPAVYQDLWDTIAAGGEWRGELQNKKKNGALYWESAIISPVTTDDGTIQSYIAVKQDITHQKDVERKLQKSEERFALTTSGGGDGLWDIDIIGKRVWYSDRFREVLGYTDEKDYPNRFESWREGLHPDDRQTTLAAYTAHLKHDTLFDVEYRLRTKNGKWRWFQARGKSLRDKNGHAYRMAGSIADISERKQMEEDLQARVKDLNEIQSAMLNMMEDLDTEKDRAKAATQAKSDFLANMSHEIRTPMNAIIGMSHLALKTDLSPRQQDYISKIDISAKALLRIINDILDFSKIEAGKMEIEKVAFLLGDVLDNLSTLISARAQEKGLEFIFNIAPDLPANLVGDPLRLGQILLNLCSNAVKFTDEGEIVISATVVKQDENGLLAKFSVHDTGIGLPEAFQAKLYHSFSQADTSTTRKYGGTGLGLTICKRLAEMMGGAIGVESDIGKGSTFWFTILFGLPEKQKQHSRDPILLPAGIGCQRVLLVDDNETTLQILQALVEAFGFHVTTATSAYQALNILETTPRQKAFSLVLMDWKMPGMNGIEASRRIKENPMLGEVTTVIMLTAYSREEIMQQAADTGIDAFLLKPVTPSVLFNTIMQAMQKNMDRSRPAKLADAVNPASLTPIRGARILLAEDNEINRSLLREILEGAGFVIEMAKNGREALEQVHKRPCDAVLMDIQMPVMDGKEATRRIRDWECFKNLPIIAMTANAMAGDKEKSLAAGMNDHLTKPIDLDELNACLARWIDPQKITSPAPSPGTTTSQKQLKKPDGESLKAGMPDIDWEAGLKNVAGKQSLYLKLLEEFIRDYKDVDKQVQTALELKRIKTAKRCVHTAKGLSATIGAHSLHHALVSLEASILNNEDVEQGLEHCGIEMNRLASQISGVLSRAPDSIRLRAM